MALFRLACVGLVLACANALVQSRPRFGPPSSSTSRFQRLSSPVSSGAVQLSRASLLSQTRCTTSTRLYVDLFGLGPTEVIVCVAAAALLYGPDKVKGQLRDSGMTNTIVTAKGLKLERQERIKVMTSGAEKTRKKRAWGRVNNAIAEEDEVTLTLIQEYEELTDANA